MSPRSLHVSTFWLKLMMALTGVIFAAFVLVHMLGNLKVFTGAQHFNEYARWLRAMFAPLVPHEGALWLARVVLLVSLGLHVGSALVLSARARRARGDFRRQALPLRSLAARTMLVTGVGLLAFVVFHILDMTLGVQPIAPASFVAGSPYANLVASLRRPAVAAFYMVTMLSLALHLAHGLWTATHDLGVTGPRLRRVALHTSGALAIAIMLANVSIPLAVLLGILQ